MLSKSITSTVLQLWQLLLWLRRRLCYCYYYTVSQKNCAKSELVEIWRSSDKNKFAQFFETRCTLQLLRLRLLTLPLLWYFVDVLCADLTNVTAAPNNGTEGSLYHLLISPPPLPAPSTGRNYVNGQFPADYWSRASFPQARQYSDSDMSTTASARSNVSDNSTTDRYPTPDVTVPYETTIAPTNTGCECNKVTPSYPLSSLKTALTQSYCSSNSSSSTVVVLAAAAVVLVVVS